MFALRSPLFSLLLPLLFSIAAYASPPTLTLPKEVAGEAGAFIVVRAESDSAWVNFQADSGLAVFPANLLSDRKATVVTARAEGRYRLFAYTGNDDGGVDAEVVVVVGTPPPTPVPPGPGPTPPGPAPPPTVKADAAAYIYEKDQTGVPAQVMSGLNRLNREKKLLATLHEIDTTDGTQQIPEQYRSAVEAAREAGLPALVVTSGAKVIRVIKNPKTVEDVWQSVP